MKKLYTAALALPIAAVAFWLYADLLPDRGGHARSVQLLGWDVQDYGACFRKQLLLNGSMVWESQVFRYRISSADFARMRRELMARGWRCAMLDMAIKYDGDTVVQRFYPTGSSLERVYLPVERGGTEGLYLLYNGDDELLYVEHRYGHVF